MSAALRFLSATRGRGGPDWVDCLAYVWLLLGVLLMLCPVLWLLASSFKTEAALDAYPPTLLPLEQATSPGPGGRPLPLFRVASGPHAGQTMAELGHIGLSARMVPEAGGAPVPVPVAALSPVRRLHAAWSNFADLLTKFDLLRYAWNSTFITVVATLLTLLVNSMAAYGLSKYRFGGRDAVFLVMLATLMIPPTIVLVPNFLIASRLGLVDTLWGVILPAIATPTGVFLLRQYMLTIPDELIEAARMDHASEWRIYWRIILPLTAPALAVLAIFSVMWRWNDFLWPMVVLTRARSFTLPLALYSFEGDLTTQWNYLLAMTVLTLLPITILFAILQRHIVQGIASSGVK